MSLSDLRRFAKRYQIRVSVLSCSVLYILSLPLAATEKAGDWTDQEQKRLKEAGLPYKKRVWCVGCARLNHPDAIMWERERSKQAKRELMVNKLAAGTTTAMELPTAFRIFYKTVLPRVQVDPAMYVDGKAPRSGQLMKKVKGKLAVCPPAGSCGNIPCNLV